MNFESILESIARECRGVLGIALMERDGIAIAQVQGQIPDTDVLDGDIGSAGAEFGRIIGEIDKASDALGGGAAVETVVGLSRFNLIFHHVDDDVMLVMALATDGNLGKARYLIRRNLLAIRQEL